MDVTVAVMFLEPKALITQLPLPLFGKFYDCKFLIMLSVFKLSVYLSKDGDKI